MYRFMRGRLPVVVRALFILELHRCHIHTQLLEYVKGLKDILDEIFWMRSNKDHRTTELQLDCGCI